MGEKKTKLMLYSTLVEIEVEVGVELSKSLKFKLGHFKTHEEGLDFSKMSEL